MSNFLRASDPSRPLPASYVGKVVSRPLECLPQVNASACRSATELSLAGRGLEVLDGFELFPNLECLWLQNNRLVAIENLDGNVRIKRLFASHNRVATLRGSLLCFKHLEELDLSSNAVSNLDKCLETLDLFLLLRKLWLSSNPVAQEIDYRLRVLARMPSLVALDNQLVTDLEREAAAKRFGFGAKGGTAVRASFVQRAKWRAAGEVFSYDALHAKSTTGAAAQGGYFPPDTFGSSGASGVAAAAPLPSISAPAVFGCEPGTTSVQRQFAREVEGVQRRRLAQQLEKTAQEFDEARRRGDWAETIGAATGITKPPGLVVSALINICHPQMTEDVVTRQTRQAMLTRNVEPELLADTSPYRAAVAARDVLRGGTDARAQMLSALAPVVPSSRATHPITDALFTGFDSFNTGGPAAAAATGSAAPSTPARGGLSAVFRASGTMSAELAATLSRTGVQPVTEAQLARMVLAKTGLRLKVVRSRAETLARYGLDPSGNNLPPSDPAVSGLIKGGHAPTGQAPAPPRVENGRLGEWDKMRLRRIFQESDIDGSGELSRDEIKGALSQLADYGFCVSAETSSGGDALGSSAALLGTQRGGGSAAANAAAAARTSLMLDAVFDAIDADGSGTVTWREFIDVLDTGVVPKKAEPLPPPAETLKAKGKSSPWPGSPSARPRSPTARTAAQRPKTPAEQSKERQAAMLEQATALLATARRKKEPEPLRVPQLRFRSLTPAEAAARSERYFRAAAEAWRAYQRVPPDAHDRELQWARLHAEMVAAGERGNRLALISEALGGSLDPPERAPTPPRARHDTVSFTSLAPLREEQRRFERGGRKYRVAYPGDEASTDEDRTRSVLRPGPIALAEEEEVPELRGLRLVAAASAMRTLGDPLWERYRLQHKARQPHAVHRVVMHL